MAKATRKKAKRKAREQRPEAVILEPRMIGEETVAPIYSNYAQVRGGPMDFSIVFGHIVPPHQSKMDAVRKEGYIDATARSIIVLTPEVARGLRDALTTAMEQHEEALGGRGSKK